VWRERKHKDFNLCRPYTCTKTYRTRYREENTWKSIIGPLYFVSRKRKSVSSNFQLFPKCNRSSCWRKGSPTHILPRADPTSPVAPEAGFPTEVTSCICYSGLDSMWTEQPMGCEVLSSLQVTLSPAFHCHQKKCTRVREGPLLTCVNVVTVAQIHSRFAGIMYQQLTRSHRQQVHCSDRHLKGLV